MVIMAFGVVNVWVCDTGHAHYPKFSLICLLSMIVIVSVVLSMVAEFKKYGKNISTASSYI